MASTAAPPPPTEETGEVGLKTFETVDVDLWGGVMMAAAVGLVATLYFYFAYCKWRAGRGRMNSVAAGQLRLSAARGRVAELQLISRLPDFQVDADLLGFTPLHAAAVQGHAAAMVWLLKRGADLTRMKNDDWRDTTLHYAAGSGSVAACEALLAWGADPAHANALDELPELVATRAGHPVAAGFLKAVREGTAAPLPSQDALITRYLGAAPKAVPSPAPRSSKLVTNGASEDADSPPASPRAANGHGNGKLEEGEGKGGESFKVAPGGKDPAGQVLRQLVARGNEGWGTEGTEPKNTTKVFRVMAVLTQSLGAAYLVWRALRTLNPGYFYFYSIPFWLAEFSAYCLSFCFIASLFNMIERPERRVEDMLPPERVPHVDIFICTYSEPPEIVEPTAIAALNINWPGEKLTVHILDDGKRPIMARLVKRLAYQCRYMQRAANIVYCGRDKKKGVPHHAKAGNINSCLLKEGPGKGEFILVLDCDMIVHPDILQKMIGHFYRRKGDTWVAKRKAAFMQTPQDFFNVDASDPMVHCARFFYGPMLQGRDGIGAAPCCGTGVVFRRDILVSIGGQAYGSITEDYNSAMTLMSAGFATMFLNERLSYGMAPDLIQDVMTQRLRWAMGALQILMKDNPLRLNGLTAWQSLLFFEAAAHHYLAIPTIFMGIVPIVYLFAEVSPMVCANLWEFAVVFGTWYLSNRLMMIWVHRGTEGGSQELWRGSQMWVWMAPNHLKAIWKVLIAENPIIKKLFNFEIGFTVTKKDKEAETQWMLFKKALTVTWPHLTYYVAFAAGVIYFIVTAALGEYSSWQIMIFLSAMAWGTLIVICLWPPVWTMVPRVETEAGWKICWDPFADPAKYAQRQQSLHFGRTSMAHSRMLSGGLGPGGDAEPQPSLLMRSMQAIGLAPARRRSFSATHGLHGSGRRASVGLPSAGASQQPPSGAAAAAPAAVSLAAPQSVSLMGHLAPTSSSPFGAIPEGEDSAQQLSATNSANVGKPGPAAGPSYVSPFAGGSQEALPPLFAPVGNVSIAMGAVPHGANPSVALMSQMQAPEMSAAFAAGAGASARDRFASLGRVGMKGQLDKALLQSALLTSVVLPERLPGASSASLRQPMVSVLLDAQGRIAPASGNESRVPEFTALLGPQPSAAPNAGAAAAGPEAGTMSRTSPGGRASLDEQGSPFKGLGGSRLDVPLALPQSSALLQLNQLTGASVLASFPLEDMQGSVQHSARLPRLQAITEAAEQEAEPDLEAASGGLASSGGPQASIQLSVAPGELPLVAPVRLSGSALAPTRSILRRPSAVPDGGEEGEYPPTRRSDNASRSTALKKIVSFGHQEGEAPAAAEAPTAAAAPAKEPPAAAEAPAPAQASAGEGDLDAEEDALAEELASEAAQSPAVSRVAAISTQLVSIAAALSPTSASMLLDQGYSMVVPVLPESIYEHTLAARPNFRERERPGKSYMFLLVNGALLLSLVAGSILDVKLNDSSSDIAGTIGVIG